MDDLAIDLDEAALELFSQLEGEGLNFEEILQTCEALTNDMDSIERAYKYKAEPVGAKEFITSKSYMNASKSVWPAVIDEIDEMCTEGKYVELVLTGAIGVAKCLSLIHI